MPVPTTVLNLISYVASDIY